MKKETEKEAARKGNFHLVYGEVRAHITSPSLSLPDTTHESICHKNMYIYYHRKDKGKVVTLTLAFTYTHISSSINQTNELFNNEPHSM